MADENKKTLVISAVDDTEEAIASAKKNFASLSKETQAMFYQTSKGIVYSQESINKGAKKNNVTIEEQIKLMEANSAKWAEYRKKASEAGKSVEEGGKKGGAAMGLVEALAGKAGGALGLMAVKALSVGAAMETIRRGYMQFAAYDTKLRQLQNSIGGTRSNLEGFGSMFKDVAMDTGDDLGRLQLSFKSFLDKSMVKPADAKKMFPDIALYAKGAVAEVEDMSSVMGDSMRIMSIPASDYKKVLEATVHTAGDLNVDVKALAAHGPRLAEVMSSLGSHGAKGFAEMTTYVGIANRATGDTAQSINILSNIMERMLSGDKGMADALNMPVEVMLAEVEKAKQSGSPLGWLMGMFKASNKQNEIMAAAGIRNARVVREFERSLDDVNEELEKTQNAADGLAKSRNITDGPDVAVARLTNSVSMLVMEIGHLLDAFGVTKVLQVFAELLGNIATGAERLISLFEALKRFELPAWMPQSWGEFGSRFKGNILGIGPRVRPGDTTGGKPHALSTEPVRPYENVPLTRQQPGAWQQPYAVGERPGGARAEKMSYSPGGGGGGQQRNPLLQNASFTGTDPSKKLAKAIAEEQGGGYGSSMDAKYLPASYHPGGSGGFGGGGGGFGSSGLNTGVYDQAGPAGSHGTGYGGGTDLAPPHIESPQSARPGGRTSSGNQDNSSTGTAGGTASGDFKGKRVNADVMKTRVQQANTEWMKDPKNQQKIFRTLQAEGGGNIAANLEQMSNYAASRGKTLQQVVEARGNRQFYGPLRRFHGDPGSGPMMKHERDAYNSAWTPAKQAAWDKASNEVFSGGSNRINYATDQGTVGDPNYNPNTMTNVGGNMFGVQPGTGKWVSAQRGKPEVSGPVTVAASQPTATAAAAGIDPDAKARLTTVGNYRNRDPNRSALVAAAAEASKNLPKGWRVEAYSGERGKGPHSGRSATDFRLIDPKGNSLPNYQDPAYFKQYEQFAQDTHTALQKSRPDLAARHRFGGYFSGSLGKGGTYGAMDTMHQDLAGPGRMAAGSWEGGVNADWRRRWGIGVSQSVGIAQREREVQEARAKAEEEEKKAVADAAPKTRGANLPKAEEAPAPAEAEAPAPAEAPKPKKRDDEIINASAERDVNVNLKVNDSGMQFARASMRRQADREVRETRWNSHSDIGAA